MNLSDLGDQPAAVGPHQIRLDGDIAWVRIVGVLERPESEQLYRLYDQIGARQGYLLVLSDATAARGNSPEARRFQHDHYKLRTYPSYTAVYGANLVIRTLIMMGIRANQLIHAQRPQVSFHSTEAEARAALAEQRPQMVRPPASR